MYYTQRHIQRDRGPSTDACLACWAMGTKELKQCMVMKNIFCAGPTGAAKAEQKSLVPARQPQRVNQGRTLSFVFFDSPFASVSRVSRSHPSLVSLTILYTFLFPFSFTPQIVNLQM
jgi:hypothetical protein